MVFGEKKKGGKVKLKTGNFPNSTCFLVFCVFILEES